MEKLLNRQQEIFESIRNELKDHVIDDVKVMSFS
jgi:hypothetical protein